MMGRYSGRIITKNPVVPSGPSPVNAAPGIWTLPEVTYWNQQGRWPSASADPYWSYVSFLLGTTSTNTQQNNTFLDSSANNFTITRNGNTTQGTFSPYDTLWSNYFDGSGDYLTIPSNTVFSYGTGDFTVEAWVYKAASGTGVVLDYASSGGFGFQITDTQIVAYQSVGASFTFTYTLPLNSWAHIALVRTSGNLVCYVNGALVSSLSCTTNFTSPSDLNIGRNAGANSSFWNGYLSNLRIVKGTAVYTAAFTPPAAPLTVVSGTSLLTCQSNRFRDASTNNFAITRNGDTRVSSFSPFVLAPPGYDTSVNGGSGYFDGSGDYLTTPSNAAFAYGTGDFTWEMWVFPTAANWTTGNYYLMDHGSNGGTFSYYQNVIRYYNSTTGTGSVLYTNGGTIPANQWTHVAVSRSGGTTSLFVNGALRTSASDSYNYGTAAVTLANYGSGGLEFQGYISNARIVKGTAVYTAAFTPPTTPLTAITNTSLLLNFTNAGIFDASMNNDMETVGNAQVTTAVSKYGGSSVSFDGNGDYLVSVGGLPFSFGTGDFTIELWAYYNSIGTDQVLIDCRSTGGVLQAWALNVKTGGVVDFIYSGSARLQTSGLISTGAWYHIAVTRASGTMRIFVNGTQAASVSYSSAIDSSTTTPNIGRGIDPVYTNGYIDDLRITNGYARYTANFTPPTAALPVY